MTTTRLASLRARVPDSEAEASVPGGMSLMALRAAPSTPSAGLPLVLTQHPPLVPWVVPPGHVGAGVTLAGRLQTPLLQVLVCVSQAFTVFTLRVNCRKEPELPEPDRW